MKRFTNWKHQQIIIQLTHSVLFYSAANWYIGALVYWHIIKLAHWHIILLAHYLIFKFSEFAFDNQFFLIAFFNTSYNLCGDTERFADGNHFFGMFG